jgi:glycosyltransferase involved in cell wall biosynthesis
MKILLVTDQYIDIRPDGCYCNFALLGTLKNMSVMGELYIAAAQPSPKKPAAQPINQRIDFITAQRVIHFRATTTSISDYISNSNYNKQVLKDIIPQMNLVIGYTPGHNLSYAFKVAKKHNIPYLSFLVACPWDGMRNHQRLLVRLLAPIYFLQTRKIIKGSDYVHYVTKSFLQKRYPTNGKSLGCSDTNLGAPNPIALSNRLEKLSAKSATEQIRIVTIGHIDIRYKGQEYVIRALANLVKAGECRYHYYLIGAGEGARLKELCKQLNIENHIHFLGRKTPNEVMDILSDADIYAQPSFQEGLPRAVVEAMSTALPCIGFDTGGLPELIAEELIVPKKDVNGIVRCVKMLENAEFYKQCAIRNFELAKEYEHSLLTAKIQNFFEEIKIKISNHNK